MHYLRGRRLGWLAATTAVLVVGLLCYVKVLLVLPVLALVALGYFASGGLGLPDRDASCGATGRRRSRGGSTAVLYVVYYAVAVPQPFVEQDRGAGLAGALADTMLGTAFGSSAVGGPWRWDTRNPPTGYADPPAWAVHLAWVVLVGLVVLGALLRRRTGRAWLLLALSLAGAYLLLLTTRAPVAGAGIGLEMRYLTETVCALVLALGLAWLPVRGAVESSEPRPRPLLAVAPDPGPGRRARPARTWSGPCQHGVVRPHLAHRQPRRHLPPPGQRRGRGRRLAGPHRRHGAAGRDAGLLLPLQHPRGAGAAATRPRRVPA